MNATKAIVMEQTLGQTGKFGVLWPDNDPPTEAGTWIARNLTKWQAERACSLANDSIAKPYDYPVYADDISPTVMCRIVLQLCQEFNMTVREILDAPWYHSGVEPRIYEYAARNVTRKDRS